MDGSQYPLLVGQKLGCSVTNNAQGGSAARAKMLDGTVVPKSLYTSQQQLILDLFGCYTSYGLPH